MWWNTSRTKMVQTRSQTAVFAKATKAISTAETTSICEVSLDEVTRLTNYLSEKKVEDFLKNIVVELCKATPDNVPEFIIQHISKNIANHSHVAPHTAEVLLTDVIGETLVCHLEPKHIPDYISSLVDATLVNDETVVITPNSNQCPNTGDPIGTPLPNTSSEYDHLDEVQVPHSTHDPRCHVLSNVVAWHYL